MTKAWILAVSACIFFISCSTSGNIEPPTNDEINMDDINDNPEDDGDVTDISLSFSVLRTFEDGMLSRTDSTKFSNNKPIETVRYNSENELINTTIWYYLQNGLFDSLQTQLPNGLNTVQEKVEYDNDDRLIKWVFSENVDGRFFTATELYSYQSENLITMESPDGNASESSFELNADGLIFRETNGDELNEVVWDNDNNPIQLTESGRITTFEFLENPLKKSFQINYWINIFNSENNYILWSNRFNFLPSEFNFGNNYISAQDNGFFEYDFQYEFDNKETLTKKTTILNGILQSETEYFYEQ